MSQNQYINPRQPHFDKTCLVTNPHANNIYTRGRWLSRLEYEKERRYNILWRISFLKDNTRIKKLTACLANIQVYMASFEVTEIIQPIEPKI